MLNYRVDGAGQPLLMAHGFGVSFPIWEQLVPLLGPHFQLILPELPGVGASPLPPPGTSYYTACASALTELRIHLGIEQWAVLGYSSGTRAVEAYLQCDAPHVGRVALLCPAYVPGFKALGLRLLIALDARSPAFGDWVLTRWRLRALIRLIGFNGHRHPAAPVWHQSISVQPMAIIKSTLRDLPRAGAAPLALPPLPALFIWGARDLVAAPPHPLTARDCLIPADHSAPISAAPAIAQILLPFLQSP